MVRNDIINGYFSWLCDLVCIDMFPETISYTKLLSFLHEKPFTYLIAPDENRAEAGIGMRHRYAYSCLPWDLGKDIYSYLDGPCSVLEMMVALAVSCEEDIMDDPEYGDRTKQWFWSMVRTMGLGNMDDNEFNRLAADAIVERFLNRDYEPDGKGGLFWIRNCTEDLRRVEIWHQLCWYLDSTTDYSLAW